MPHQSVQKTLDEIFGLYEKHGAEEYIGEPVSQIEHACQCAQLAAKNSSDEATILAAFFHDIGHICVKYDWREDMGGHGHVQHEIIGADFLRQRGFPEKIASLVKGHVAAKRYMCAIKPDYYKKLSEASKITLEYQGGPMSESEAVAFKSHPLFSEFLKMRAWDEAAKEINVPLSDLKIYREIAERLLLKNR